jgi:CHAD domain-containing protein
MSTFTKEQYAMMTKAQVRESIGDALGHMRDAVIALQELRADVMVQANLPDEKMRQLEHTVENLDGEYKLLAHAFGFPS